MGKGRLEAFSDGVIAILITIMVLELKTPPGTDWHALRVRFQDVVSIGYPGPVVRGRPLRDPVNLGNGWVGFDFQKAFGRRVKIINDAAMQALGSYRGGSMLFLGLGTGLGSALIIDDVIEPMELAHLTYKKGKTFEEYLGAAALKRRGKKKWVKSVFDVVAQLKEALQADYVVLGGGNVKRLRALPSGTFRGDNENAREGGFQVWNRRNSQWQKTWKKDIPAYV